MLNKVLSIVALLAFVILSALVQSTTPSTVHPVVVLLAFVLIYLLALGMLTFLIYGLYKILKHRDKMQHDDRLLFKRSYNYSLIIALAPVMVIGLTSIGKSGLYSFLLILVFEAIAIFYISKRY